MSSPRLPSSVTPGDEVGPATAPPAVAAPENKVHGLSLVLDFIYFIVLLII